MSDLLVYQLPLQTQKMYQIGLESINLDFTTLNQVLDLYL